MRDNLQARLNLMFSSQAKTRHEERECEIEENVRRMVLLDKFINLRRDVIRLVMDQFACHFKDKLYNCRVLNDDNNFDDIGRKAYKAGITLRLYKGANPTDELKHVPHYSIVWDEANAVVRYYKSNATRTFAGESHYDGKSDVHDITADLIERKLLSFTDWIFSASPA